MPWKQTESWALNAGRRRNMQANRRRDTGPELRVRSLLHGAGLRYRVDIPPLSTLPNRADIVFTRSHVAVFIDGCYWHGCPEHYRLPRVNSNYWAPKIEGNRARDRRVDQALVDAGWTVLRFWEHEPPDEIAAEVIRCVRATS